VVITASDFAQRMFGGEAIRRLVETLKMQWGKTLPKLGG
jgi:hypothetical protein